jgi:hypothetical protein
MWKYDRVTEDGIIDIEFREDGGIRALMGRATYVEGHFEGEDNLLIFDWLIVAYAVRLVGWAAILGRTLGYRGSWGLGLHSSNMRGLSGAIADRRYQSAPRFNDEFYRAVTAAPLADLEDRWQPVVGELVGRLLHALGTPHPYPFADVITV